MRVALTRAIKWREQLFSRFTGLRVRRGLPTQTIRGYDPNVTSQLNGNRAPTTHRRSRQKAAAMSMLRSSTRMVYPVSPNKPNWNGLS